MATTGIVNGHNMRFYDGGTAIAFATEGSLSYNVNMLEVAHKDTTGTGTGWDEVSPGSKSGSGSCSMLHDETGDMAGLFTKMSAGTALTLTFTTGVSGDIVHTVTAYIESMEINAPNNELVTASVTFRFSGESVQTTN